VFCSIAAVTVVNRNYGYRQTLTRLFDKDAATSPTRTTCDPAGPLGPTAGHSGALTTV